MILDWIKRQRAAAKQAKEMKTKALIQEQERDIGEFKSQYFADLAFPIVIISKGFYTAVSDLREYYWDIDIHRWGIESNSELVDSVGDKYNLKFIETGRWVPYQKKTGTMDCGELKRRLAPLLYMPRHKKEIDSKKDIREVIDLLVAQ
jgi:hypothetical protein